MHIGILAAAAHAATNNSPFTVFYNPRFVFSFLFGGSVLTRLIDKFTSKDLFLFKLPAHFPPLRVSIIPVSSAGLVPQNSLFLFRSTKRQHTVISYHSACDSVWCSKLRNLAQEGNELLLT